MVYALKVMTNGVDDSRVEYIDAGYTMVVDAVRDYLSGCRDDDSKLTLGFVQEEGGCIVATIHQITFPPKNEDAKFIVNYVMNGVLITNIYSVRIENGEAIITD